MTDNPIDPEAWETFKSMMDASFLAEMIDTYLSDAPMLIEQMRSGIASSNVELVRRAAHSLKSNSANIGALRLAGVTRELEMIAKGGGLDGAGPKFEQVTAEYSVVATALEALKNEQ